MRFRILMLLLLMSFSYGLFAQAVKVPVQVTDMLKIQKAGNVQLSPDGKQVVYTLTRIIPKKTDTVKRGANPDYEYQTQIWLLTLSGKNNPELIDTSHQSSTSPAFSPRGNQIAYTRAVKGKSQVFLYAVAQRTIRQLTNFRYGATKPVWSPDGSKIAFSAQIPLKRYIRDSLLNPDHKLPLWPDGKPGFASNADLAPNQAMSDPDGDISSVRAYLDKNEEELKAKVINRLQFQGESATSSVISLSHVFVVDTLKSAVPKAVTAGFYNFSNPVFSGNKELFVNARISDVLHPDDVTNEQIYKVAVDGTHLTAVVGSANAAYSLLALSPSGRYIAYQRSFPGTVNVPRLFILDLKKPAVKAVQVPLDRAMADVKFTADEKTIYFVAQNNGGGSLYQAEWLTGKLQQLTSVDEGIGDYDLNRKQIVFVKTTVLNPSELYSSNLQAKNPVVLSRLNADWLSGRQISVPEKHSFVNSQGMEVEYWVMKPYGFDPARKYPLLLEMHGGPASMWGPGDESMWHEFQYYCAKGIAVVYSNPRGSSGYGEAFLKANLNDWGPGPASDVLTALDRTVKEGWADTTKLLISGGSYAGYLTCWIISHDHRFLAASSQRGVYDFRTFFGEANVWRMIPRYFGGYPWEPEVRAVLDQQSPINYLSQITTPYLIIHGENDLRTGVTQSEMLYKSLRFLGKPVEYVQQPGASHELVRSGDNRQRIDQLLRTYEFFDRFIRK